MCLTGGTSLPRRRRSLPPPIRSTRPSQKRVAGKASLDDVEIDASWQLESGPNRSVRIWGSGLGIWEKTVQFRLSREQVVSVLKMLLDAKVGTIPQPGAKPPAPVAKAPIQLRGELTVVAGDVRFHRQQVTKGEQSEALAALVTRILEFSEKAAADGMRASNLQDGLAKVADGTLAPQTFSAVVRRAGDREHEPGGESFLLRMEGRRVTDRLMPKGQLPPPARELTLSDADFRKLVLRLREDDPESLARNTYAPVYTDVTVAVLGHDKNVPARAYLDVTAETHGEKQKAFDRMYALFRELHERVQKEGTPAKGPAAAADREAEPRFLRRALPRQNREHEADHAHADEQPARRLPAVERPRPEATKRPGPRRARSKRDFCAEAKRNPARRGREKDQAQCGAWLSPQYRGRDLSIRSAQRLMPPARLRTFSKPFSSRNATALPLRPPVRQ